MPNKTPKKQNTHHLKYFFLRLRYNPKELIAFIILVALLILPFAIWISSTYQNHQKQKAITVERAQFTQAESDIDTLAKQITTKFGQPDDQKKRNVCDYTSNTVEFERGSLYCDVIVALSYSVQNQSVARTKAREAESFIKQGNSTFSETDPDLALTQHPPVELGTENYSNASNLSCLTTYYYFTGDDSIKGTDLEGVHLNSSNGLLIELSCSKNPVLKNYYPIGNNFQYWPN